MPEPGQWAGWPCLSLGQFNRLSPSAEGAGGVRGACPDSLCLGSLKAKCFSPAFCDLGAGGPPLSSPGLRGSSSSPFPAMAHTSSLGAARPERLRGQNGAGVKLIPPSAWLWGHGSQTAQPGRVCPRDMARARVNASGLKMGRASFIYRQHLELCLPMQSSYRARRCQLRCRWLGTHGPASPLGSTRKRDCTRAAGLVRPLAGAPLARPLP